MKPIKVSFYVYVDDDSEATELAKSLHDFVEDKRRIGIAVTAKKLTEALNKFKNNFFVNNFLK
jgi:hypothetical protein